MHLCGYIYQISCYILLRMNKLIVYRSSPLRDKRTVLAIRRKRQYLHIFSIKLFIQWEALNYALIAGVERTQLYPLVGRISASRAKEKVSCVCLRATPHLQRNLACSQRLGANATVLSMTRGLSSPARRWNLWVEVRDDDGNKFWRWNPKQRQHHFWVNQS